MEAVNRIKRVIRDGNMALAGPVGSFSGPAIVELIGLAGFDAVSIDLQHSSLSLDQVQVMIVTAERMGIAPVVRIPSLDPPLITRLLDMGAQGIRLSGVSSVEEVRALVDATRFPPTGSRSLIGNSRAVRYSGAPDPKRLAQINDELFVWVSIEDMKGVEAIDEIAAVEGVDSIGVGPHDLASQLGVLGEPDPPQLVRAIDRVIQAVSATGSRRLSIPIGNPVYPRSAAELLSLGVGYTLCIPFPEIRLLASFRSTTDAIRAAVGTWEL